ncbi:MAG: hypothetical protein ACK4JY_07750 [Brevundimonas sp.]|uniref:hypothetical protein n=1 Tax=Brevundimonas sp. TaxID=1871086 RepID=UPI00391C7A6D
MTFSALPPPPPRIGLNTATVGLIMAIAVQFACIVAFGARVEAQVSELQQRTEPLRNRGELTTRVLKLEETTEPIRRGDLIAIQRDVAWIRENMERERSR